MCGRFTLRAPASIIAQQFDVLEVEPFRSRFNVAPSQLVPMVRLQREQKDAPRELTWLQWGLVPSWAKDPKIGNRMINVRAETAHEKPAFRNALRHRRCLMVADGFYEWAAAGRTKQPHFFHFRDDRPFAFAGIWESWKAPDDTALETCALLTTDANETVKPIHDRMPVILPPDAYQQWLDSSQQQADELQTLLQPYPGDDLEAYAVSTLVNSPAHEDPACVERQGELF